MSADVIPLKVRISDGSVAPEPLTVKRTAATREEVLAGLSVKERMLIHAIVTTLEELTADYGDRLIPIAKPLLQGFQDATGVNYAGCAWDIT